MYSNEYPYRNFHDINLDWVMEKTAKCVEKVGAVESVAQQAKDTAEVLQPEVKQIKDDLANKLDINNPQTLTTEQKTALQEAMGILSVEEVLF